jgi:hypothetical protein
MPRTPGLVPKILLIKLEHRLTRVVIKAIEIEAMIRRVSRGFARLFLAEFGRRDSLKAPQNRATAKSHRFRGNFTDYCAQATKMKGVRRVRFP